MTVKFKKYQGTGNDFIIIDNRKYGFGKNRTALVKLLCDRKFGIGADGLMLFSEKISFDFEMVYFNSDGRESSMCGNGGRCLVKFAHDLGLIENQCSFWAVDGAHSAEILKNGIISLKMKDVEKVNKEDSAYILDTGSPHYVIFVKSAETVKVDEQAKKIRYSKRFSKKGINVNFVEKKGKGKIFMRTYERGVEGETLSCGTGVVASSLAYALQYAYAGNEINVETPGGNLKVQFERSGKGFKNVYLIGPAEKVFEGEVDI